MTEQLLFITSQLPSGEISGKKKRNFIMEKMLSVQRAAILSRIILIASPLRHLTKVLKICIHAYHKFYLTPLFKNSKRFSSKWAILLNVTFDIYDDHITVLSLPVFLSQSPLHNNQLFTSPATF